MFRIPIIALVSAAYLHAEESRQWTNPEGTKSFAGEYISHNGEEITLRRSDGSEITFSTSKLHEEDHEWLKSNHPIGADGLPEEVTDNEAIFGDLKFGDSREDVMKKLKESAIIEAGSSESTFFGQTELNGNYRTKNKVGGLFCYLFYDFDQNGHLHELTMRTEPQSESDYETTVNACWEELPKLISMLHGRPMHSGKIPAASTIEDGALLGSHVWRMEGGGNIMLGIANVRGKYEVSVRFTLDKIEMRPTP